MAMVRSMAHPSGVGSLYGFLFSLLAGTPEGMDAPTHKALAGGQRPRL